MFKKVMLLLVLGLMLSGCGKEEETTGPGGGTGGGGSSSTRPVPFNVNNYWVYLDTQDSTYDTLQVVGEVTYNGNQAYQVIYTTEPADTYLVYYDDNAGYLMQALTVEYDTFAFDIESRMLKIPMVVGDQWDVYVMDTTFQDTISTTHVVVHRTGEILGTENVTVPAGSFDGCFKVKYTQIYSVSVTSNWGTFTFADTTVDYGYIKDGVGVVKSVQDSTALLLTDYNIQ